MKTLIIGGEFSGEWRDVLDGAGAWVDIVHAATHPIRWLTWAVNAPLSAGGELVVLERYRLPIAVHPQIAADPRAGLIVQQALANYAMTGLMRTHAVRVPLPDEVPDTPAELLGRDGFPT